MEGIKSVVQETADRERSCIPDTQGGCKELGSLVEKKRRLSGSCWSGKGRESLWVSSGCLG